MKQPESPFEKTVVFTDLHGDIDVMAASFAQKGLMTYDGGVEKLLELIKNHAAHKYAPSLEKFIIKQENPVRFIFLGDCLDRYLYGYHMVQVLMKVRWEKFNIFPVFLMGNHDMLNLLFLTNPYKVYRLHRHCGPSYSKVTEYLRSMGMEKSIKDFINLHAAELARLQVKFFNQGYLEFPLGHYDVRLKYRGDYSLFNRLRYVKQGEEWKYATRLVDAAGLEEEKVNERTYRFGSREFIYNIAYLVNRYSRLHHPDETNWWTIYPDDIDGEEKSHSFYFGELAEQHILSRPVKRGRVEILPLDWRLISLVWRKYYGGYFRGTRLIHLEADTIYAHGGISPLALTDSFLFGPYYYQFEQKFRETDRWVNLDMLVDRTNRLFNQSVTASLNDMGFQCAPGAEVVDQMGYWRGCHHGFPQFGGPLWCDYEWMEMVAKERWDDRGDKILQLYKKFSETYGIKRIICGHTPYYSDSFREEESVRYVRGLEAFEKHAGLEYLCIDNGCSRAYRREKPVTNGIIIDKEGNITAS